MIITHTRLSELRNNDVILPVVQPGFDELAVQGEKEARKLMVEGRGRERD